jgi:DNA-binding NtrC family response regulator
VWWVFSERLCPPSGVVMKGMDGRVGMRKLKVLLVDDEVDFISAISERLSLRDIDARTASSGEEALYFLEEDTPDVVVLDIMLPGIRGTELLKLIRQEHPLIQVILITGANVSTRDRIEAMHLGAFDYLSKPLSVEELIDKLQKAAVETNAEFT